MHDEEPHLRALCARSVGMLLNLAVRVPCAGGAGERLVHVAGLLPSRHATVQVSPGRIRLECHNVNYIVSMEPQTAQQR